MRPPASAAVGVLAVCGVLACAASAVAVTPDESGEHGFRRGAFLARGMAARPVAMGDVFTAVADDPSAVSWNPAGLGRIRTFQAVATYDAGGRGLGVTYAAGAMPAGPGVAGAAVVACNYGEYDLRDANGFKTGTDSAVDLAAIAGYALRNPAVVGGFTGLAVEAVSEAVGGTLVGLNAGSVIPVSRGVSAGWAVLHLGPKANGYSLPGVIKGGVAYVPAAGLTIATDAGYGLADEAFWAAAGGEYSPVRPLTVRAGYRWIGQDEGLEGLRGVTAGLGFSIGRIGIDYAFQPFGDMGASHRVAVRYVAAARSREAANEAIVKGHFASRMQEGRLNIAVGEMEARGVPGSDAGVIADILRRELVGVGSFNVVEKQQMDRIMAEQTFQQYGCTTEECIVKMGRLLNVQAMIVGSFGKLADRYVVNIRVVDVETAKVVYADSAAGRNVDLVLEGLKELVGRLVAALL